MLRRAIPALVLLISVGLHAAAAAVSLSGTERDGAPLVPARSFAPSLLGRLADAHHLQELRQSRAALVEAARAALRDGHLDLGAFLLEAGRIDADEQGLDLDIGLARARYEERKQALRDALVDLDLARAVPVVFGDLKYYGRPGGLMASALVDGGGSCEQLSQLIVAAAHDVGLSDQIALRYYGGLMDDGASHITPVALVSPTAARAHAATRRQPPKRAPTAISVTAMKVAPRASSGVSTKVASPLAAARDMIEQDLMSGLRAVPGGVRLAPADLVEVYARAHGLAPALVATTPLSPPSARAAASAAALTAAEPARSSLTAGLPPNGDRFPGSLPLYAARAVHDPTADALTFGVEDPAAEADQQAKNCAYLLRTAMLSPPSIDFETPASPAHAAGLLAAEPRRIPTPARLERESMVQRAAETIATADATDPVDRLMAWACLAALGDVSSVDFSLAREYALASESVRVHRRGREEGKKALAAIDWSGASGAAAARKLEVDYGGRSWVLLAIEGGDRVVLDLAVRDGRETWGRISALAALVVAPASRVEVIATIASLPLADQVDVMHEVFHTHDHMRPWASSFDLDDTPRDDPAVARFLTRYQVFRALAWRLWEGQRPIGEILDSLATDARAAGTDAPWRATLLDYLAHNALGLYAQRSGGREVIRLLREAAERDRSPSLEPLRHSLAYLEAQPRLDNRTLADAWRAKE